jgi:phosphoglycerate dehydrogenase-like enzyme
MVFSEKTEKMLRDLGHLVVHFGSRAPGELVEEILPEVQVIIGQTAMPKERLDCAPKLRAILNVKANWEPNIDYAEAHARGIHVLSAAPAMAPAVAEFPSARRSLWQEGFSVQILCFDKAWKLMESGAMTKPTAFMIQRWGWSVTET